MISTTAKPSLSQDLIDEGRSLLTAIRRLDLNTARWVSRCLDVVGGDRDRLRAEWKKHFGLTSDLCAVLMGAYETYRHISDEKVWKSVGLLGASRIKSLRSEKRAEVIAAIHADLEVGRPISIEHVYRLVDKAAAKPKARREVSFVAGRERRSLSAETVEAVRRIFSDHPDLLAALPEAARLELGLE